MKTSLLSLLLWLPLADALAQIPPRDLDLVAKASWPEFARGLARAVTVSGNYAYVAYTWDSTAGLQVIDISNPAGPQRVGGYDTTGYI